MAQQLTYVVRCESGKRLPVCRSLTLSRYNVSIQPEGNPATLWVRTDMPQAEIEALSFVVDVGVSQSQEGEE